MEQLIDNGEVGIVIVKDMSRLGRNYLQVGIYTDVVDTGNKRLKFTTKQLVLSILQQMKS